MMRLVYIGDVTYRVPQYVQRGPRGWQVRFPGYVSVYFADSNYGGTRGSLREAAAHLAHNHG